MNQYTNYEQQLQSILSTENIKVNEPLKLHTSFKVGGPADLFVTPTTLSEVQGVYKFALENNIPLFLLGNGSNLLVRDGGIRGIVMKFDRLNDITIEDDIMTVQMGTQIIDASKAALEANLTGLEFACGIPGTVGGALAMNAGAYGGEVKDILKKVLVLTTEGEFASLTLEEMEMSYRKSAISKYGYIALEAVLQLKKGEYTNIKETMDDLTARRVDKQPLEYPSAGSTFKRPEGYFAGKLIQDSNLQGVMIGGAQVSEKHAGFIINRDNATAADIIKLIKHVQQVVKEKFGVQLETEVKIVGEDL
ncbi:MAG: UDP-N-acetylmuramate dehydrogenase [Bacillaceae bacterium]